MKLSVLFTLLILNCNLIAQTKVKKEILLDEHSKTISAVEFKKKIAPPDYKFTYTKFENDSTVYGKLVQRKEYGSLKMEDREKIISELAKLTGRTINKKKTIIINFYYLEPVLNQQPCIDHYTSDRAYKRFIKRNADVEQFFVTTQDYKYHKDYVFEDKNSIIGNMLFPNEIHCGNYIIIKPYGHFYRQVSEYRQDEIPAILEADWNIETDKK